MNALKILLLGAVSLLMMGVLGCSPSGGGVQMPGSEDALPADLQAMQGGWSAGGTNECAECSVVFSGYTVRLRYRRSADEPLIKKNIGFESIDEKQHLLIMHDNGGAWGYGLHPGKEGERLELEFYSTVHHIKIRVDMKRDGEVVSGS